MSAAITKFVSELDSAFGVNFKNLQLFARFVAGAKPETLSKLNALFHAFVLSNREAIIASNVDAIRADHQQIKYNDRIHLPIGSLLKNANELERESIFMHLRVILNEADPSVVAATAPASATNMNFEGMFNNLLKSDGFQKLVTSIQTSDKNDIDFGNVMNVAKEAFPSLDGDGDPAADIGNFLSSLGVDAGEASKLVTNVTTTLSATIGEANVEKKPMTGPPKII